MQANEPSGNREPPRGGRGLRERLWNVWDRLADWWHPPTHLGLNRVRLTWLRAMRRWRSAGLFHGYQGVRDWLDDWWHPPTHSGLNRAQVTWLRIARRWPDSAWYVRCQALFERASGWVDARLGWTRGTLAETWDTRFHRWLFRWQTAVWLAAILATGWAALHYGRPWLHHYQERHYARQAEEFLAKGDLGRAMFRARAALILNATNAGAIRVLAQISDLAGSTNALYWWRQEVALQPTLTNQLALAAAALRFQRFPFPIAAKTLSEIEPAARQTAAYQRLAGLLALRLGQKQAAEQHLAELVQLDPTNQLNRISLAAVELQSTNASVRQTARATLEGLAGDAKVGAQALRSLVAESASGKDYSRAAKLSEELLAKPQANFQDWIAYLGILRVGQNTNLIPRLSQARNAAGTNLPAIIELANWMNISGQAQLTLDWLGGLPPALARQGMLPLAQADAYAALQRWADLEAFLDRSLWPGGEALRFAFLARAATKQSKDAEDAAAWRKALNAATSSPKALKGLANLAAAWGWPARQEQVLWLAARKYPEENWPVDGLLLMGGGEEGAAGVWRAAKLSYQKDPEDEHARNNYAALSLVMNRDLPEACQIAASLYLVSSNNPFLASTHAFALLKQGRPKEALAVFQKLPAQQLRIPSVGAYYGMTLVACGDTAAAQPYLERSVQARLLPEEVALVKRAQLGSKELVAALTVRVKGSVPKR